MTNRPSRYVEQILINLEEEIEGEKKEREQLVARSSSLQISLLAVIEFVEHEQVEVEEIGLLLGRAATTIHWEVPVEAKIRTWEVEGSRRLRQLRWWWEKSLQVSGREAAKVGGIGSA